MLDVAFINVPYHVLQIKFGLLHFNKQTMCNCKLPVWECFQCHRVKSTLWLYSLLALEIARKHRLHCIIFERNRNFYFPATTNKSVVEKKRNSNQILIHTSPYRVIVRVIGVNWYIENWYIERKIITHNGVLIRSALQLADLIIVK